jgi:hypothetical protein
MHEVPDRETLARENLRKRLVDMEERAREQFKTDVRSKARDTLVRHLHPPELWPTLQQEDVGSIR